MNTKQTLPMTLCILRDGNQIVLAKKKRGFGVGKWNGYGGKLKENENLEQSLVREVKEESTVDLISYEKRGEIVFDFPDIIRHVHIFEGTKWNGGVRETEEMQPQFYTLDEIPFSQMWESDVQWFPLFLRRVAFAGTGTFDENHNLLSLDVKEV